MCEIPQALHKHFTKENKLRYVVGEKICPKTVLKRLTELN